jgi:hypothetical protein
MNWYMSQISLKQKVSAKATRATILSPILHFLVRVIRSRVNGNLVKEQTNICTYVQSADQCMDVIIHGQPITSCYLLQQPCDVLQCACHNETAGSYILLVLHRGDERKWSIHRYLQYKVTLLGVGVLFISATNYCAWILLNVLASDNCDRHCIQRRRRRVKAPYFGYMLSSWLRYSPLCTWNILLLIAVFSCQIKMTPTARTHLLLTNAHSINFPLLRCLNFLSLIALTPPRIYILTSESISPAEGDDSYREEKEEAEENNVYSCI